MTSVEFINYFAPRSTLVLTFVVLFCFALFFAYLIAFKNATKGKNYIITFFVFIIIILIGVVLLKSQDNITKANKLEIIKTPYYLSLSANEKSYFKEALLNNPNVENFSTTITIKELKNIVNEIDNRRRDKLDINQSIRPALSKDDELKDSTRAEIGTGIADVIQNELISIKDVIANIDREEFSKRLNDLIDDVLEKNLKTKVKEKFPVMQMFFSDKMAKDVSNTIKGIVMENQEKIFEIFSNYAEENINFSTIITDKISNFSLDKLEEIINGLAKKELKHIEVIGAILGAFIGLVQYFITLFVK